MRIVGFGASSVQGVDDGVEGGFIKRLERIVRAAHGKADVVNLGIGGNTTVDMLARVGAAREKLPARVVVLLGCNDVPRDRDGDPVRRVGLKEYAANLAQIFAGLRSEANLFVTSFAVSAEKTGVRPEVMEKYMAAATAAARAARYDVWDLCGESLAWGERYWAADGLHYGPEGHERIAREVARRLAGVQV